jgi:hypothetical protein
LLPLMACRDLSYLTRDWTCALCNGNRVLTISPPEKSHNFYLGPQSMFHLSPIPSVCSPKDYHKITCFCSFIEMPKSLALFVSGMASSIIWKSPLILTHSS